MSTIAGVGASRSATSTACGEPAKTRRTQGRAAVLFLFGALWLIFHPYLGIYHDARLYVFQALRSLAPDQFGLDLYFRYGSQDSYTVAPSIHAAAAGWLGVDRSTVALVILSQSLFLLGLWLYSRSIAKGGQRWIFLIAAAVLPGTYFNLQVAYAESFFTARPAAEGLVLIGLAALLLRRTGWWAMLAAASSLLHPLVGVGGWLAGGCYLVWQDRRWIAAWLAAGLLGLGLALAGVDPFANLFVWLDSEWFRLATLYRNVAFLRELEPLHWVSVLWSVTAVASCWRRLTRQQHAIVGALAAASALGYLTTLAGADLTGNTLLTQLQLHRVYWLFQLTSYLALASLVRTALAGPEEALIGVTWLLTARVIPSAPLALALLAGFWMLWFVQSREISLPVFVRVAGWLPLPLWAAGGLASSALIGFPAPSPGPVSPVLLHLWFLSPVVLLTLLAGLVVTRRRSLSRRAGRVLLWTSMALLLAAAACWDRRPDPLRALERNYGLAEGRPTGIRPAAEVYWDDRYLSHLWFVLGQRSYVTVLQGSGMVFSRELALEWRRRMEVVRGQPLERSPAKRITAPPIAVTDLDRVCRRDTELDYVITARPGAGEPASFEIQGRRFYLNDCRLHRPAAR